MKKADIDRLQAILDGPPIGVNLELNMKTGDLTWGCVRCGGTALIPFSSNCRAGATFPGCKREHYEL